MEESIITLFFEGKLIKTSGEIDLLNRAFRYGDGLFESILICENHRVQLLDLHMNRIYKGAETLSITTTNRILVENMVKEIVFEFCSELKKYRMRLYLFRKGGGGYLPLNNNGTWVIDIQEYTPPQNKTPLLAGICPYPIKLFTPFSQFKTLNGLPYIYGANYMKLYGWDDLILLNHMGRICEGLHSNLFYVVQNEWFTPSISEGCIDGVYRKKIIHERKVHETSCTVEFLKEANQIYLCNSIKGLYEVQLA